MRIIVPGRLLPLTGPRLAPAPRVPPRPSFLPLTPSSVGPRCAALRERALLSGAPPSPVSSLRTGTTSALWQRRRELEQYKSGGTEPQTVFVEKKPEASRITHELLVASDPVLRGQYLNFRNGIRFGKLLEDIDAFAGNIAFLHCDDGSPNTRQHTLVTACLDRLDLLRPVTLGIEDLTLVGQAAWAGRSSLQIDINLFRKSGERILSASMVFVSVGPDGKGCQINPLVPHTDEDKLLFAKGAKANAKRKEDRKRSLKTTHPTEEEITHLHGVMMSKAEPGVHTPLQKTQLQTVSLMQPQEKNRAGKIFGGYLMREAYELAYTTASAFCASSPSACAGGGKVGAPTVFAVDDVSFAKPVGIGDVVTLTSRVVYTGANEGTSLNAPDVGPMASVFQIRVEIEILHLATGNRQLSNEFHFTFVCRDASVTDSIVPLALKPIMPWSYTEGMLWLDGRRRMLEAIETGKAYDSTLVKMVTCT